jgi:hypothetical protein
VDPAHAGLPLSTVGGIAVFSVPDANIERLALRSGRMSDSLTRSTCRATVGASCAVAAF